MILDDISDGYRTVLEIVIRTVKQTQTLLPENQPSRVAAIPAIRQTIVISFLCSKLSLVKIPKSSIHATITRMSQPRQIYNR